MSEQDTHQPPEPQPIQPPDDFPVTWDDPNDSQLQWEFDSMHITAPSSLIEVEVWETFADGWNAYNESVGLPVRTRLARINSYLYMAIFPVVELEAMPEAMTAAEEKMNEGMYQLNALWDEDWLPEIKSHLAFWDAYDLQGANLSDLVSHWEETLKRGTRLYDLHMQIALPAYMAISKFDDLYRDLFGSEEALGAYRLLQALPNETVITDQALWALSRQALDIPPVREAIEQHSVAEIPTALTASTEGQAFWAEFQAFLEDRGQRSSGWDMIGESWIENPASPLQNLKDYLAQPERDMDAEIAAMADARDRAIESAQEQLKGYPQQVKEAFTRLLEAAQKGTVLTEDHGFWIDYSAMYRVRQVIMELGRRFAETGVIDMPDDIFHLSMEEVQTASNDLAGVDVKGLIVARKDEIRHFEHITPPPILGTDHGPPPDNFLMRMMGKFFGAPLEVSEDTDLLKGHPGSPGKMQGVARLLESATDGHKLNPGDVLVAQTTAPPWTPLFATAGAIVTDTGGVLSHCAVVAREYGIPAVVGTQLATDRIQDGQQVEVDGNAGIVRIL